MLFCQNKRIWTDDEFEGAKNYELFKSCLALGRHEFWVMSIWVSNLRRPKETVEVLTLQEFLFPHKAFQRLSPALPQNLMKGTLLKRTYSKLCTWTHCRSTSLISTAGSFSAASLAASRCSGATCNPILISKPIRYFPTINSPCLSFKASRHSGNKDRCFIAEIICCTHSGTLCPTWRRKDCWNW